MHTVGQHGAGTMRRTEQGVDPDHLVTLRPQQRADPGSDEPGRTGEQHSHGNANGSVMPSCGRQWVQVRSAGTAARASCTSLLERHQVALELGENVDRGDT